MPTLPGKDGRGDTSGKKKKAHDAAADPNDSGQGPGHSSSGSDGSGGASSCDGFGDLEIDAASEPGSEPGDDGYLHMVADGTLSRPPAKAAHAAAGDDKSGEPEDDSDVLYTMPANLKKATAAGAAASAPAPKDAETFDGFPDEADGHAAGGGDAETYMALHWGAVEPERDGTAVVVTGHPASDDEGTEARYEPTAADPAALMAQLAEKKNKKKKKGAKSVAGSKGRGRGKGGAERGASGRREPQAAAPGRGRGGAGRAEPTTPAYAVPERAGRGRGRGRPGQASGRGRGMANPVDFTLGRTRGPDGEFRSPKGEVYEEPAPAPAAAADPGAAGALYTVPTGGGKAKGKKNKGKGDQRRTTTLVNPVFDKPGAAAASPADYVYSESDDPRAKRKKRGDQRTATGPQASPAPPPRGAGGVAAPVDPYHHLDERPPAASVPAHELYAKPEDFKPYHRVFDQVFSLVDNNPDAMRFMIRAEEACRGKGPQETKAIVEEVCRGASHFVRQVATMYAGLIQAWADMEPGVYMAPSTLAMATYDAATAGAAVYEVASSAAGAAGSTHSRPGEALYDFGSAMTGSMRGMTGGNAMYDVATTGDAAAAPVYETAGGGRAAAGPNVYSVASGPEARGASLRGALRDDEQYAALPDGGGGDPSTKARDLKAAKQAGKDPFIRLGIEKSNQEIWKAEIRDGLVKMIEGNGSMTEDRNRFMRAIQMCLAKIRKAQPNWPQDLVLRTAGEVLGKLLRDPYYQGQAVVCETIPTTDQFTGSGEKERTEANPLINHGISQREWEAAKDTLDDINYKLGIHKKLSSQHAAISHVLIAMWADFCQQGLVCTIDLLCHGNNAYIAMTRDDNTVYFKINPASQSCHLMPMAFYNDAKAIGRLRRIGMPITTEQKTALPGYCPLFPPDGYEDFDPSQRFFPSLPMAGQSTVYRNLQHSDRPFQACIDKATLDMIHQSFSPVTMYDACCRILTTPQYVCIGLGVVVVGAVVGAAFAMGGGGGGGNQAAGIPGTAPVAPPVGQTATTGAPASNAPVSNAPVSNAPSTTPTGLPSHGFFSAHPSFALSTSRAPVVTTGAPHSLAPVSLAPDSAAPVATTGAPNSAAPNSLAPVPAPVPGPAASPTFNPTFDPTSRPSFDPTFDPTSDPTSRPSFDPTFDPTSDPTSRPSFDPTFDPTSDPTSRPSFDPTSNPTTQNPTDTTTGAPVAAGRADLNPDPAAWNALSLPQQNTLCRSIYGGVGGPSECGASRADGSRCCEFGGCGGC